MFPECNQTIVAQIWWKKHLVANKTSKPFDPLIPVAINRAASMVARSWKAQLPLLLPGHSSNKIIRPHANSGRRFFAGNASLHKNLMLALITFSPDQHTALLPRHTAHCHTATLHCCQGTPLIRLSSWKPIQEDLSADFATLQLIRFITKVNT